MNSRVCGERLLKCRYADLRWTHAGSNNVPIGMPACPCCGCNDSVSPHGFRTHHFGRTIVGFNDFYTIMTRRYICKACQALRQSNSIHGQLQHEMERAAERAGAQVVSGNEHTDVPYTFMGYDSVSLDLLPAIASVSAAVLTHKLGMDIKVVNLMRACFCIGVRPMQLPKLLAEMQSLEYSSSTHGMYAVAFFAIQN